jgi:hypothetical protein
MSSPAYDLRLNPRPSVSLQRFGQEQERVLLVDNVLLDANALVDYASWEVAFTPAGNPDGGYPGVRAPAPLNYVENVVRALSPIVERAFGLDGVALSNVECSLSLTTTGPEYLTVQQRTPHIDTTYPLQFAWLHYLCPPGHGGTSFYRHRATGFETLDPARAQTYDAVRARELAERPPPLRYADARSDRYVAIGSCAATFNRLAIYRSCLLHSGDIPQDVPLLADPRRGRLTANIFVNYRQC